jgi:hypothetical protein
MPASKKYVMPAEKYLKELYAYAKNRQFTGYDLYDGLNSVFFRLFVPFKAKWSKIFWIQFNKVSFINFRPLFLTEYSFNAKAGALFLRGLINTYGRLKVPGIERDIEILYDRIVEARTEKKGRVGFGYNFEWAARAFIVPPGTPNSICTVFAAKALMEYFRFSGRNSGRSILDGILDFFLSEMILFETEKDLCFAYIPSENAAVHNVNLMVASFLSEYILFSGKQNRALIEKIEKAVHFSLSDIGKDGSWPYGLKKYHRWADNFHTAYNIEALIDINRVFQSEELYDVIGEILGNYFDQFFTTGGLPKYMKDRVYPIDIHVIAEIIILFNRIFSKKRYERYRDRIVRLRKNVDNWVDRFYSGKGYFYCRKGRFLWNKIPYMRWAQAWVFYALSTDLAPGKGEHEEQ